MHFFFQIDEESFDSSSLSSIFICSILSTTYQVLCYSTKIFFFNICKSVILRNSVCSILQLYTSFIPEISLSYSSLDFSTFINLYTSIFSFSSNYFTLASSSRNISTLLDLKLMSLERSASILFKFSFKFIIVFSA